MILKYKYGNPFETDAVTDSFNLEKGSPKVGTITTDNGFCFQYNMKPDDIIYGLGEANRGINKRGYIYTSDNADDCNHTEDKRSLYASHNFIIIDSTEHVGLFFDYPASITFDVGYTSFSTLVITCARADLYVYVITGESSYDVVKQFRKIIGQSYIPPKFAFGFGQSRWGYKTPSDFEKVVDMHRSHNIPLDMVYMDIDYMEDFKDFTINENVFPDFTEFVKSMKSRDIRLIPIIDAGVKIEKGYDIYEEGIANNYFCKKEDGSDFIAAVWPGNTHLPDFLNENARIWFGDKYRFLIEQGIEGFWNDMNEPAIFYTPEGLSYAKDYCKNFAQSNINKNNIWELQAVINTLANHPDDYKRFYHNVEGKPIRHDDVHNIYGYNMTRSASEAFERIDANKRFLMFSRSSYIGMHRYGGVWTGDNKSWWAHLLLNIKMMPSLNMCGFIYSGADIGGFGDNATEDLMLRWLAFGVFTPLMRNHSANGTREQEFYQFDNVDAFRNILNIRYRLIPYLYSEYMKAVLSDDMYLKPMAFDYPDDGIARHIEDQLLLGNEVMIAPVYTPNAPGRFVYLPEEMLFIKFTSDGSIMETIMGKGSHYIEVSLNEVPLFIRKNKCIPVCDAASSVDKLKSQTTILIGYPDSQYTMYDDDGISKDYDNPSNYKILKK